MRAIPILFATALTACSCSRPPGPVGPTPAPGSDAGDAGPAEAGDAAEPLAPAPDAGAEEAPVPAPDAAGVPEAMLGDQDTPVRIDFEDGKAEIRDLDRSMLDVVVARLRLRPDEILFLIGHADSAERPGRAVELSRERVDAVRRYLMQHGINEDRLIPDARGALEPVTLDDPEEARRANRRVDFVFQRATATPP